MKNKISSKIIESNIEWVSWGEKEIKHIVVDVKNKIETYKKNVNETLSLSETQKEVLNFKNAIHKSEDLSFEIGKLGGIVFAFSQLHTEASFRDSALKVELEMSKILNEFSYDENVYKLFSKYYNGNFKKEKKNLTTEENKIVEDTFKAYKKMGMHLDKKTKKALLNKRNKINKLAQEFEINATKNYEIGLYFNKNDLNGIPEEYVKSFKFDEKKKQYFINCSGGDDLGTDYPIIKKYCTVAKTREAVTRLNEQGVGEKNNKKLREILKLREEIRVILGYKSWAQLSMEDEMMSDPKEVNNFLEELIKKLKPDFIKYKSEIEKVLNKNGEKLSTASFAFGRNLLKQENREISEEEYRPYFEMGKILEVLFKTWEKYFNIKVEKVSNIKIFHEDTIFCKFTDNTSKNLLGHGIFDLHPRTGKYGHACVADIFKKAIDINGNKYAGLTYLICNFKKSINGKTFISLSDMNTFFHEAGHMLHMILMKNNFISTGSTSRDFVEIPSQFHENFLYNEKFVKENFKHFETGREMPKNLIINIKNMNKKGELYSWLRTSTASLFDQEIHSQNILKYTRDVVSIDKLFENLWSKNIGIKTINLNRHFSSKWGHLVGGYDAKYYSYVISKVYAMDFWYVFAKGGIKKGGMSEKYKKFLEGANTISEKVLVKTFLGRKISHKPFLEMLKK